MIAPEQTVEEEGGVMGVSPASGGRAATPAGPSQQAVSGIAGIPDAGQWAVVNSSGDYYTAVQIDQVTPKLIKYRGFSRRAHQYPRDSIVALFDDKEGAAQLIQSIDGVRGGFREPRFKERKRHQETMERIAEKQAAAIARVIARATGAA